MKKNTSGFAIIEILIGIFIFTLGLLSTYALVAQTINFNEYSKNSIIASNLAREGIEIVRNIRDNNYKNLYKWNKLPGNDVSSLFQTGVYYKVENDFSLGNPLGVKFEVIPNFGEGIGEINSKMQDYVLCLDSENKYTYNCIGNKKTYFYKYIKFDDVLYNSGGNMIVIEDSLKLTSKVVWYNRGYHEIELKTVLSDFLRQ